MVILRFFFMFYKGKKHKQYFEDIKRSFIFCGYGLNVSSLKKKRLHCLWNLNIIICIRPLFLKEPKNCCFIHTQHIHRKELHI